MTPWFSARAAYSVEVYCLAAAVGVEDDAGRGVAGGQGFGEGVDGQFGAR